ncbi:MAG: FG-GAP-like repeat-containing protein [Bacteroidota bacterium]
MKQLRLFLLIFTFTITQSVFAQAPVLGSYAAANLATGANADVFPSVIPGNTLSITATTSSNFKGNLKANPVTGVVTITNARPAGTYNITVRAFNGALTTTTSFPVVITGNTLCQNLRTSSISTINPGAAIAAGDFNNDGKQDFLAASNINSVVDVRLGDGLGGSTSAPGVPVGIHAIAIGVADFNGDGNEDFITANETTFSVRLGNGTGGFTGTSNIITTSNAVGLAISDFNNDGKYDFTIVTSTGPSILMMLGDGGGGFVLADTRSVLTNPESIIVADFNKDNFPDVAITNRGRGSVSVLLGNGTGGYLSTINSNVGLEPNELTTCDFNKDGNLDLIIGAYDSLNLSICLGNGSGNFTFARKITTPAGLTQVSYGDFNGDGNPDIVASTWYGYPGILIYYGDGNNNVTGTSIIEFESGASSNAFLVGDFNADGMQDIVSSNFSGTARILLGGQNQVAITGNGISIPAGSTTPSLSNHTDFGTAGKVVRSYTVNNSGTGGLTIGKINISGPDSSLFTVSGINLPAEVKAGSSRTFSVTFVPTTPGIKSATINLVHDNCATYNYSFAVSGIGAASSAGSYPTATVTASNPGTTINPLVPPANYSRINATTSAGFKGILQVNPVTGAVNVTNAQPAGTYTIKVKTVNSFGEANTSFVLSVSNPVCSQGLFSVKSDTTFYNPPSSLATGDFNGDGKQDILYSTASNNTITCLLGNGSGSFTQASTISINDVPAAIVVADFNSDGKQDIAVGSGSYPSASIYIRFGNGAGGFTGTDVVGGGFGASSIAVADFNNDGKIDLLCNNYWSNAVAVLLGNGSGGFEPAVAWPVGNYPIAVSVSDFNNDGNADFAVANLMDNNISIRLGDGTGNFSIGANVPAGINPSALVSGDFNNDGKQDLAVGTNGGSNISTLSVRLGNGAGSFSTTSDYSNYTPVSGLVSGDFNGDGKQDLLYTSNRIYIAFGNGAGGISNTIVAREGYGTSYVTIGDYNGDGRQDFVSTDAYYKRLSVSLAAINNISVAGNNTIIADGDNTPATTDHTDFDGATVRRYTIMNAGTAPLIISSINIIGADAALFTRSSVTFPLTINASDSSFFTVRFAPLTTGLKTATVNITSNGCGDALYDFAIQATAATPIAGTYPDAIIAAPGGNANVTPSVAPLNAAGMIASASGNFKGTLQVDNITGAVKIINAYPAGTYTITVKSYSALGAASSSFKITVNSAVCKQPFFNAASNVTVGSYPRHVAVGDFNNDGKQDMAAANYLGNSVSIRLGDGAGGFTGATNITVGTNPYAVLIGDFNGDGFADFASANSGSNNISIRLGDGTGNFTGTTTIAISGTPSSIRMADFNNDGFPDLAVRSATIGSVTICLGTGRGNFNISNTLNYATQVRDFVIGDFNNDSNVDIAAVSNTEPCSVILQLGDGAGNFSPFTDIASGNYPGYMLAADFNRDGNLDFAIASTSVPAILSVRLGDGFGSFTSPASVTIGAGQLSISSGDFNGDGIEDIAVAVNYTNSVSIFAGDGSGRFKLSGAVTAGAGLFYIATGDFNGDGRQDLVTANETSTSLSVFLASPGIAEIDIKGNNTSIADGSTTPALANHTDFGNVSSSLTRNFTIHNTGNGNIKIDTVFIAGLDTTSFKISGIIMPATISSGSSLSFAVKFTPPSATVRSAIIKIINNDCDEADYDFAIQGTGVALAPALGNYAPTTIAYAGGNASIVPSAAPVNALKISAIASASFKGLLSVNPASGIITLTNAHPAGVHQVTVRAFNGFSVVSTVFNLTVNNPQCSQGLFNAATNITLANGSQFVAIADFNNDGKQDMVVVNNFGSTFSVALGNGTGGFTVSPAIGTGVYPGSPAVVDINGDGKTDIVIPIGNGSSLSVYMGDGAGNFVASASVPTGSGPKAAEFADFNNDGKADIAAVNTASKTIAIFLGNGDGGFVETTPLSNGISPQAFAVCDFNNDGNQDIILSNSVTKTMSVFSGNGSGGFVPVSTITLANQPFEFTTGDFNRDDKTDIAVALYSNSLVAVRLGDGTGNFTAAADITVGANPAIVKTGDFNGDGNADLAVTNYSANSVSIRFGDGSGSFVAGASLITPSNTWGLAVGDLNGDGRQDLVTANPVTAGTASVFLANANIAEINVQGNSVSIPDGSTTPSSTNFTDFGNVSTSLSRTFTIQNTGTASLTIRKITASGADSTLFTVGSSTFPATIAAGSSLSFTVGFTPVLAGPASAKITITNDDCDEALYDFAIAGNGVSSISTLGNYPATTIANAGGNAVVTPSAAPVNAPNISAYTSHAFKGTLHVNAVTGVVTISNAHPAGVYTVVVKAHGVSPVTTTFSLTVNNPQCSGAVFTQTPNVAVANGPISVAISDINNDGKQDIVVANYLASTVSILQGSGTGTFTTTSLGSIGLNPIGVAFSDLNGDGKQDLAIINANDSTVAIRLGNGTGGFTGVNSFMVGSNPYSITTGDFNGDGQSDIATANYGSKSVSVRYGDGAGYFTGNTTLAVGNNPVSIIRGDFNIDGISDLAVSNLNSNNVSVMLGTGSGGFNQALTVTAGTNPRGLTTGDFNADGMPDLAIANSGTNTVSVRLGNGTGSFTGTTEITVGAGAYAVTTGDYNGDGYLDLVAANYTNNTISVRLGNGTGNFSTLFDYGAGTRPSSIATGDFNNDGKQDFATANYGSNNVFIHMGSTADISVSGNEVTIADGDATPSLADFTNYGRGVVATDNWRIFTIRNTGLSDLVINSITFKGADSAMFSTLFSSFPRTIPAGSSGSQYTNFKPTSPGLKSATININTNDCDEPLYSFAIAGMGMDTPVLGTYRDTLIAIAGANIKVPPLAPPANTVSTTASTTTNFKGLLEVDPVTGVVSVTNAQPAGTYLVTLKTTTGVITVTKTFNLTVGNTLAGQGNFVAGSVINVGTSSTHVAIGDFNGDSKQDLAIANDVLNNVAIKLGDGLGNFTGNNLIAVGSAPQHIAIGDFNGDGKQDFATANTGNGTVSVRLGDGAGNFTGSIEVPANASPVFIAIADFNADGNQDLAIANGNNNSVTIRMGDGTGAFSGTTGVSTGTNPRSVTIWDFNDDGRHDFMSLNNGNNGTIAYYSYSTGGFYSGSGNTVGSSPVAMATADFNGDGKQDFITANFGNATPAAALSVRLGAGSSVFTGTANTNVPAYPNSGTTAVATGDFNGDGKADIAVTLRSAGVPTISVLMGNGTGGFIYSSSLVMEAAGPIAVGDFNNDGYLDFVTTANGLVVPRFGVAPRISVTGNNIPIVDGATIPLLANHTDFGVVPAGDSLTRIFTVKNISATNFVIDSINIDGTDRSLYTLSSGALPITIAPNDSAVVNLKYKPTTIGIKKANVHIKYNGIGDNSFDFAVQGLYFLPGEALNFDGVNDYIVVQDTVGNIGTGAATISAWIRTTALTASSILTKRSACTTGNYFDVGLIASGKLNADFSEWSGGVIVNRQTLTGNITVNDGLWHQVAVVRKDSTLSLYVDGVLDTTKTGITIATINNSGSLLIGAPVCVTNGKSFKGDMDELRFWNRALSQGSIQNTLHCELDTTQSGILVYYKFNQGLAVTDNSTITSLKNFHANGKNANLVGFTLNGSTSNWIAPGAVVSGTICNNVNIWLGNTPDWGLASNWSLDQVPVEESIVIINAGVPFMPEITDPASICYSLTLNNGATITIKTGANLQILKRN